MGRAIENNEGAGAQEQASMSPEIPLLQKQMAARVQVAVSRVDRYVPWGTECYTQALTAKLMLGRRNISTTLIVGFRKDDAGEIQGHAWLKIGPYFITGFRHDIDTYVINGRFQ
jgi:Transglutaminase-like superfamily